MEKFDTFPRSIKEAAICLDKIKPKWFESINVQRLDMLEYDKCIIGQLFGNYEDGLKKCFANHCIPAHDQVFSRGEVAWIKEIRQRLAAKVKPEQPISIQRQDGFVVNIQGHTLLYTRDQLTALRDECTKLLKS